jgi:ABC-type nitrate/sulfonate/bicarbonate transport system substrate-binding protein
MDTREFPVLTDEDGRLVWRLSIGLGNDTARVLAYLLRRREIEHFASEPATRLAVRIGTSLNREATAEALMTLEDRDLIAATTIRNEARGRPPKAWYAPERIETTVYRVDETHAAALLGQARTVVSALDSEFHTETTGNDGTSPPSRIRLGLNWLPNPLHAPFFLAESSGSYEEQGVDVAISPHQGSGRALDSLTTGSADVALAGAATIVRARQASRPILPIALLFQRAMGVLYTTRDAFGGPFESAVQLRGRRVGMSTTSETGLLGRLFLSQAGILDDVTVVDITGEEQAALRSGRTAVVAGSFADPRQLETEGRTVDSLLVADQFPMYGPALVTTERTLRERQSALTCFLAGTVAGWAEATECPEVAVSVVEEGELTDEQQVRDRRTFERAVEKFATGSEVEKHGWGWQRATGWKRLLTALDQTDLLTEPP